ncbi:MBL fold metallo-hydrolase [Jiella sonneratiae]|uniref:MBL fold metallo-hydrolase n=1 Tax=Jiella sonneratiae TaxID=2816856 RepID=A0ABS3J0T0_9HYPH|nr:MBL fold metallo-hydrolase [Jiella sonneratiae]MBO0903276.1 MBL fold metallo-hydrolase [Jiella sonneratiae]
MPFSPSVASFLCQACGTEFPPAASPPPACPVCEDERQFVPPGGQRWTSFAALSAGHRTVVAYDGALLGFGMTPHFAIGQRALLLRTPAGNVLWDMIPLIDRATVDLVEGLGGLAAIAISHPHYYSTMARWAEAFGVKVHLHASDEAWVMRPGGHVKAWDGERLELLPGVTLLRCGGHFAGGAVLHAAESLVPGGAILAGDILQVTPGCDGVGFMRSYPNFIPLGASAVRRIAAALDGFTFEAIYGAFWGRVVERGGPAVLERSVARHVGWLERTADI